MVFVQRSLLVVMVLGICFPQILCADEPAPRKVGPMKLLVEADAEEVPPFLPMYLTVRLKNVGDKDVILFGDWRSGLHIEVYRGATRLGTTGFGQSVGHSNKTLVKLGEELVGLYALSGAPSRSIDSFFRKPGLYTIKPKVNCYYIWDEKAAKGGRAVRVDGDVYAGIEIPELNSEIKFQVREPTEAEQGAVALLEKSPEGAKMIGLQGDTDPRFPIPYSSEKGAKVMRQIAEQFPGTIYADHANYVLGRTCDVKDPDGKYLERETRLERVKYLEQVGKHSPMLHRRAVFWKYHIMIWDPRFFPDADWKGVVRELEQMEDDAKLFGFEDDYKKQMLPVAKAMAKKGRVDIGDLQ